MSSCPKFFLSLIIAFLAIILFLPGNLSATNLLQNGDFESGISSWTSSGGGATAVVVTNPIHGGTYSVKVLNSSTSSYGIQQVVTGIVAGKNYRFFGYGRVTNSDVNKAFLRIGWYDENGDQKSKDDSNKITNVGDWEELTVEKTAPSGVASVKVRAVVASESSGTEAFAYFDDLSFSEVETSPTPSPTPTPTSSPATGTYKINDVKDEDGNTLSSVYVYVDGEYTHHYAPETLTFGEGKYCDDDKEVECGFGEHTIRLEKSGYEDWEKTITVESGFYDEDDPVMNSSDLSSSPTSASTPESSSPTPTKKITPTKKTSPSPTPEGEILGEEATPEAEITSSESPEATPSSFNFQNFLPHIFIGLGGLLLVVSGGSILLPKLKKGYNVRKHGKSEEII